jgi:hypothetical protein
VASVGRFSVPRNNCVSVVSKLDATRVAWKGLFIVVIHSRFDRHCVDSLSVQNKVG